MKRHGWDAAGAEGIEKERDSVSDWIPPSGVHVHGSIGCMHHARKRMTSMTSFQKKEKER